MEFSSQLFHLSQSHLTLLRQCPRKFQYIYLDQLTLPPVPTVQTERQLLGTQFHQMMQQKVLGLDVNGLVAACAPLRQWAEAFKQFPPTLIDGERQTEHWRSQVLGEYVLIAVYDLLIQGESHAQIVDWKTYARPRSVEVLHRDWQTRLYPYLLAETSTYAPEQITMTYWFAEAAEAAEGTGHSLTFAYDQHQHEETAEMLVTNLERLTDWRAAHAQGVPFPQVPLSAGMCFRQGRSCRFVDRCERQDFIMDAQEEPDLEALACIDGIAEQPLLAMPSSSPGRN
ncbi:PD-(D/E)XK nuclease family protein [Synechococcales cyanobacterium C]|uniref:PD-(D/E)XK nuclease family protein n=1 Tax=Petrachloros mirabilis ULC683 TaxID=2781853 RepID=A0A8K2A0P3_9CYAN|nr:PD-(D/E)XK nuclease family protein [Petrachloros mirabilis]NCJ07222.1 PD-(D/E)XK nuclease family protein [Petrachloros mirabilis ULC683]